METLREPFTIRSVDVRRAASPRYSNEIYKGELNHFDGGPSSVGRGAQKYFPHKTRVKFLKHVDTTTLPQHKLLPL